MEHASDHSQGFYVSPAFGNDDWTGALADPAADGADGPVATLPAALARLRARPAGTAATVHLRGGHYELKATLELTAADSGTPDAPVVWRSYPGETATLIGGRALALASLPRATDPADLARLSPEAREHVRVVELGALGDLGGFQSRGFGRPIVPSPPELFAGDRRLQVARWPKTGYLQIADTPAATQTTDEHGMTVGALAAGFQVAEDRPFAWAAPEQIWAYGFWHWDWADSYLGVAGLDATTRLLTIQHPENPPGSTRGFRSGQRYCFYNVLEELSAPGEYVLDLDAGRLYVWPPDMAPGDPLHLSTHTEPLLRLTDVSDCELRGLTLTAARGDAVHITGGTRCSLTDCHLHNLGNRAIIVAGGHQHTIRRCHIHDTGDGAIVLNGGDRPTLSPGGHEVTDCHIHDFSIWSRTYRPAVNINGVGHAVRHCHLHDAPHSAIIFMGNDHRLEYNHIHHVCLDTGDCGAIYTGRDYTSRGTIIRHNILTDVTGPGLWGSNGIYLDDNASGIDIIANLFIRVPRAAFIGGGMDINVLGNIMVDCEQAIHVDGRGLAPGIWQDQIHKTMKDRYFAIRANEPPYSTHYPALLRILPYFASGEPVPPLADRIADNIFCRCPDWLDVRWLATLDHLDLGPHWVVDDSDFIDPAHGDYTLPADSPILRAGFTQLPLHRVGPRPPA